MAEAIWRKQCGQVHETVCGVSSLRYYVTFIDVFSRYTFVYSMKNISEILEKFKGFRTYALNVYTGHGTPIKILRSNNGGEYILKKHGIVHQLSVPYNPAQNV